MVREVHFDVQVHQVYSAVMSVHLTLVIAKCTDCYGLGNARMILPGLKLGVLVELEERIVMVVMVEAVVPVTVVKVVGVGHVDFDEVILNLLILEG